MLLQTSLLNMLITVDMYLNWPKLQQRFCYQWCNSHYLLFVGGNDVVTCTSHIGTQWA